MLVFFFCVCVCSENCRISDVLRFGGALRDFIQLQAPLPVVDDNQKVVGALSVVGEVPENFTRLVLLCIEANDCNQIFVGNVSPRSTQYTPLHRSQISIFLSRFC